MSRPAKATALRRAKRGKVQRRTEITRTAVLAAALKEFAQLGLDGARVDRIAERAGVNKQALYYHYGNKEELFRATLASAYDEAMPLQEMWSVRDLAPEAAMRRLIAMLFEHFRRVQDGTSMIAHENRYHGKHLTPRLRRQIQKTVSPIIEAVGDALTRGQRDGLFRREVTATNLYLTVIAESMFYFTHAYTLSAILETDLLSDKAIASWKAHVEDFVLAALKPRADANQPNS